MDNYTKAINKFCQTKEDCNEKLRAKRMSLVIHKIDSRIINQNIDALNNEISNKEAAKNDLMAIDCQIIQIKANRKGKFKNNALLGIIFGLVALAVSSVNQLPLLYEIITFVLATVSTTLISSGIDLVADSIKLLKLNKQKKKNSNATIDQEIKYLKYNKSQEINKLKKIERKIETTSITIDQLTNLIAELTNNINALTNAKKRASKKIGYEAPDEEFNKLFVVDKTAQTVIKLNRKKQENNRISKNKERMKKYDN